MTGPRGGRTVNPEPVTESTVNKTPNEARADLLAARERLSRRLNRIRDDEARRGGPLSADSSDRAQEQENDEVLAQLDRATADLLAQFHHAIARIDEGHYGVCESCGLAIEPERLQAVPEATRCAECAVAARRGRPGSKPFRREALS
jgi:RNA polymerase-binding protein DksA